MTGSRITIVPYRTKQEVQEYVTLYNNLEERTVHDHVETSDLMQQLHHFDKHGFQSENFGHFRILNEDNNFIGSIGYTKIEDYDYHIGYRILHSKYRHKGYMTEALQLFVTYVFHEFEQVRRCTLRIASENTESLGLAKKCGFVHEGTLRQGYEYRNRICDFEIFSILRKEFTEK